MTSSRALLLLLVLLPSLVLAAPRRKKKKAPVAAPASSSAPVQAAPSTVVIRCPEACSVKLGDQAGRRLDPQQWEFTAVPQGSQRVEVAGMFSRPLFSGYLEVPSGKRLVGLIDAKKRLTAQEEAPPAPRPAAAERRKTGPSRLHVRCTQACKVFVDGQRRAGQERGVVVDELPAGTYDVDVKVGFSHRSVRGPIAVPGASEIFVQVTSDGRLQVTTTRPL